MVTRLGLSHNLLLLAVAMALWGLGFGLYGILWPLYVEQLGGGPVAIGWLQTAAGLSTALVVLPGGFLADRVDRKKMILWGWIMAVPAPFLFAWAPSWPWLFVGVILYFGSAFSTPAAQAYIQAEAGPRLAVAYTVVMSAFALGAVIGPAISGYLVDLTSFRTVFYMAGALYAVSTLLILPMAPAPAPGGVRHTWSLTSWSPARRPRFFQWVALAALLSVAGGLSGPYVVPFWRTVGHFNIKTIGLLGAVTTLTAALVSPLWGRLAERLGIPRALGWGLAITTAGMVGLWAIPRLLWLQASSAVVRGAGGGSGGLTGVAIGRVVPGLEAGTAYGLLNWISELAGALAPYPGALLYEIRPEAPMVFTTALGFLLVVWIFTREPSTVPP